MTSGAGNTAIKLDFVSRLFRMDQCRHGVFLSLKSDLCIGRSMVAYGEWGEGEITLLRQILQAGDTVVDVGANIGTHAIAFARIVAFGGRVYAFEPQPVIHQILSTNVVLNGLSQVSTINAGLSDRSGWIDFPELSYDTPVNFGAISLDMVSVQAQKTDNPRRRRVPLAPLDEILSLDDLRLLKADIEGMEAAMLRGARTTLKRLKPALYLECRTPSDAEALFGALDGLDYQCYWHVTPMFNPQNWKGETRRVRGDLTEVNMLCVPPQITVNGMTPASGVQDYPDVPTGAELEQH